MGFMKIPANGLKMPILTFYLAKLKNMKIPTNGLKMPILTFYLAKLKNMKIPAKFRQPPRS